MNSAKFYFVQLPSFGWPAPQSSLEGTQKAPEVKGFHALLDIMPTSDMFTITPHVTVTDKLRTAFTNARCTGVEFHEGFFERSPTFQDLYGDRRLPKLVWLIIGGKANKDDFGFERANRLIVSHRVKEIVEDFTHDGVQFIEGGAPNDSVIMSRLLEEAAQAAATLRKKRGEREK
jgi:hypothetical protein